MMSQTGSFLAQSELDAGPGRSYGLLYYSKRTPLPVCAVLMLCRAESTFQKQQQCQALPAPTLNTGYLRRPLQRFGIPKSHAFSNGFAAHVCSLCQLTCSP